MFISKSELDKIKSQIEFLQDLACKHSSEINELKAHTVKAAKMKRSVEGWTQEAREIHGERMKLMWAARKAAT